MCEPFKYVQAPKLPIWCQKRGGRGEGGCRSFLETVQRDEFPLQLCTIYFGFPSNVLAIFFAILFLVTCVSVPCVSVTLVLQTQTHIHTTNNTLYCLE